MKRWFLLLVWMFGLALAVGCGENRSRLRRPGSRRMPSPPTGSAYLLASEPAGAKGVIDLREDRQGW